MSARVVPQWLLDARRRIDLNGDQKMNPMGPEVKDWTEGYNAGYYDACRHALKALPPYVKYPNAENWIEEGFDPPETRA